MADVKDIVSTVVWYYEHDYYVQSQLLVVYDNMLDILRLGSDNYVNSITLFWDYYFVQINLVETLWTMLYSLPQDSTFVQEIDQENFFSLLIGSVNMIYLWTNQETSVDGRMFIEVVPKNQDFSVRFYNDAFNGISSGKFYALGTSWAVDTFELFFDGQYYLNGNSDSDASRRFRRAAKEVNNGKNIT